MIETSLGTGILNWNRHERVSDRYGFVFLTEDTECKKGVHLVHLPPTFGKLIAIVKETRKSQHIGDLFRGLFPETPNIGEKIELGSGKIFYRDDEFGLENVGVLPIEERDTDWLNPKMLYRVHEQTVELIFQFNRTEKEK